jgi:sulfofructose kinase
VGRKTAGRVIGLGLCVVDHLLVVDGLHAADVRTRYRQRHIAPGGTVSTAVVQAARLGCRADLITLVGDDAEGRWLLRSLRGLGVGTRGVQRSDRYPTSVAVVLVDARTGERRFVVPDRRKLETSASDFDVSVIRSDSVLLIDGHFPAQVKRAVRRARECGARVVADFNRPRPDWLKLLPRVDFPVVPSEFVASLGVGGARETLVYLHERYGGTPVVTLGKQGALALLDGRVRRIASPRVSVRDSTGAGDAFHGAFAAGLARGLSVQDALRLATRAGALNCRMLGGVAGLMTEADIPKSLIAKWRPASSAGDAAPRSREK